MREMSPLILVQFLKDSMLEALTAIVLVRVPTPIPSQAEGETNLSQFICSASSSLSPSRSTFRTGAIARFAALDSVLVHLVHSGTACSHT